VGKSTSHVNFHTSKIKGGANMTTTICHFYRREESFLAHSDPEFPNPNSTEPKEGGEKISGIINSVAGVLDIHGYGWLREWFLDLEKEGLSPNDVFELASAVPLPEHICMKLKVLQTYRRTEKFRKIVIER
jgi:hypothetical protein